MPVTGPSRVVGGPAKPDGQQDRRGLAVVFVLAVGLLVVLFNVGSAQTKGTTSPKPGVTTTVPARSGGPGAAVATPPTAATATAAATAATATTIATTTTVPASEQTFAPGLITIVATVNKIEANGDLQVNDGHFDYTIAMGSSPKVVNLAGKKVSKDLIVVGGQVQFFGMLNGHTITAQTVTLPTK